MTEAATSAPKAPLPKAGAVQLQKAAQAKAASAGAGFDILRPVKQAATFIDGTVMSTLNTMAKWGKTGSYIGLGIGAVAMVMSTGGVGLFGAGLFGLATGVPNLVIGWAAGLAAGAAAGGTVGMLTGGAQAVGREMRLQKYGEEMAYREQAAGGRRGRGTIGPNAREYHANQEYLNNLAYDRYDQYFDDRAKQESTYWQDRVSAERPSERGL